MDEYYVYCLLDPRFSGEFTYGNITFDHKPFYIGKGKGKRINEHIRTAQMNRDKNKLKVNKILSIQKSGLEPIKLKIYENLEEQDALNKEMDLIKIIGRKDLKTGILLNLTNGGENNWCKFKDLGIEEQNKIRLSQSLRMKENNPMKNPDTAKKCGDSKRGVLHTDDYKSQMSISLKNSIKHKVSTSSAENKEIHRIIQEKNMKPVLQYDMSMKFIKEYPSIMEASRKTNIRKGDISSVLNGRQKTAKGYIFSLKEGL